MDFLCFFINNILLNIKIKILNEKETRRIIIQGIITYLEPYTLYIEHKIITKVAIHQLKGVLVYKTLEFIKDRVWHYIYFIRVFFFVL